jgi:hypothetical protein
MKNLEVSTNWEVLFTAEVILALQELCSKGILQRYVILLCLLENLFFCDGLFDLSVSLA